MSAGEGTGRWWDVNVGRKTSFSVTKDVLKNGKGAVEVGRGILNGISVASPEESLCHSEDLASRQVLGRTDLPRQPQATEGLREALLVSSNWKREQLE